MFASMLLKNKIQITIKYMEKEPEIKEKSYKQKCNNMLNAYFKSLEHYIVKLIS